MEAEVAERLAKVWQVCLLADSHLAKHSGAEVPRYSAIQ